MKREKQALIGVLVIFLVAQVAAIDQTMPDWIGTNVSQQEMEGTSESGPATQQKPDERAFSISDEHLEGTLDPMRIEQTGYASSGNISARTDTMSNLAYDLPLDEVHNWIASEAEVSIWNLTKLYAINGTFEEGMPGTNVNPNGTAPYHPLGWDVYCNSTDAGQVQMASFDSTGRSYITADNQGGKVGQNEHGHYQDTRILWTQSVDNAPYTEDFILSFDYFYLRGPIDKNITFPITGNCSITVFADGDPIWNMSLLTLDRRGIWESSGELPITVSGISGAFDFEIGLVIDETLVLDKRYDYDTDGAPDGIGNAAYITVYLDDVSFVKATPPTPPQVGLEFTRGTETVAVTGTSGSGSAVITNQSYWQTSPVSIILSSNTSVSFDYKTRLLSHRFTNSTSETDISKEGVAYTAQLGISPDLTLFTYIGFLGDYENPGLRVEYPIDWENTTVLDPFLSDVTSQCSLGLGFFDVPGYLLDRLGWWKFTLQSPNYAKSISIQKYNEESGLWVNSTLFRSGNITRTQITLGTDESTPNLNYPVNLTWSLPNASIWSEESLTGGFNGQVNSTSWMLGALNTSAGQWSVTVCWTNGTEVACDTATFDMHHTATLTPKYAEIQTESGLVVTNFLYYVDADNGEYLMDEAATIEGNWSSSTVTFNPSLLHNWWETNFDTAAVGGGVHLVIVNASRPYFDDVSCQFVIESILLTQFILFVDGGAPIEVGLNEKHSYEFRYELLDGTGIDDAGISVSFSPTVGLSVSNLTSTASGNYSLEIFGVQSGMYTVTVSANKSFHYVGFDSFMIEVGEFGAILSKENGSADLVSFGVDYRLVLRYANMTGYGLTNATVEIVDMTPSDWVPVGPLSDEGNGYYSILLLPSDAGTFTVVVKANLTNHETQYATFSLTVAAIPSVLVPSASGGTISIDQSYTLQLSFEDEFGLGLEVANITVLSPPAGLLFYDAVNLGGGLYNVTIEPLVDETTTFEMLFRATLENYQSSTTAFSLLVRTIPTSLDILEGGSSEFMLFTEQYTLTLVYVRTDTSENVSSAHLDVFVIPSEGLSWVVRKTGVIYEVTLTAETVGKWQVFLTANKTRYVTAATQFELEVRLMDSSINQLTLTEALVYDRACNFTFTYLMFNGTGIIDAEVVPSGFGAEWFNVTQGSPGQYVAALIPERIGSFEVTFSFNKDGFSTKSSVFTFSVVEVTIEVADIQGLSGLEDQLTIISLSVIESDTEQPVTGATVVVQVIVDLVPTQSVQLEDIGGGQYSGVFTMPSLDTIAEIRVYVSLENYVLDGEYFQTELHPEIIDSSINQLTLVEALIYDRAYNFTFTYLMLNGTGIVDAEVVPSGFGEAWFNVTQGSPGQYVVTLIPQRIGSFEVTFRFNKDGFGTKISVFSFSVVEVPFEVADIQGLSGLEDQLTIISLSVIESDTEQPVTGATVVVQVIVDLVPTQSVQLEDIGGGQYSAVFTMPSLDTIAEIRIYVSLENYVLDGEYFQTELHPEMSTYALLTRTVQQYSPLLFLTGVLVVGLVGQKVKSRKRKAEYIEAMAVKRRFDDIRGLLGVIVLHRSSGIPIYSKILKEGFEDSMIAGFIAAITSFRSEFEVDQKEWQIIPISDIIRTVSSQNLICAFITMGPPTGTQEEMMMTFARAIGFIFDSLFENVPTTILDAETTGRFETLFDEMLDGALLARHKTVDGRKLPRGLRPLARSIANMDTPDEFELEELASIMTRFGLEEARAYKTIMGGIEIGYLVPIELESHTDQINDSVQAQKIVKD